MLWRCLLLSQKKVTNKKLTPKYFGLKPLIGVCVIEIPVYITCTAQYSGLACTGVLKWLSVFPYQLLYVLAERAIKPQEICYLLHLCNGSEVEAAPSFSSSQTLHHSLATPLVRQTASKGLSTHSNTKKKRKDSDNIVFIQISDIHLDREFSEVTITYTCM